MKDYKSLLAASNVPEHLRKGLELYLEHGISPGHFMTAVLSNDLREAVGRGDDQSLPGLAGIVRFLHNHVPASAWGSRARVDEWEGMVVK